MPAQYAQERILHDDVQRLLQRVEVRPDQALSRRFPAEHACRVRLQLHDRRTVEREKSDYAGFRTRPATWDTVTAKFDRLASPWLTTDLRDRLLETIRDLEHVTAAHLAHLLERA